MNWLTPKTTRADYNPHERAAQIEAVHLGLEATVRAWREHHRDCKECATQDWYDPWWKNLLCQKGRDLFARWLTLSMANPPPMKRHGSNGTKRDSYLVNDNEGANDSSSSPDRV